MTASDVRAALLTLEREELARYCRNIRIEGEIAQSVVLQLDPGQDLWTARGTLLAYDPGVDWSLQIPGGAGKAISRAMSGEGVTLVRVEPKDIDQQVVLTANEPGKLLTWDLSRGDIVCTSGSFVAALGQAEIDVTMAKRAGAALFGGAGLFLQRLSGDGIAIVHGAGDFVVRELAPGERMLTSTGNLAVFSGTVDYNIRAVGGCLRSLFGGEGLFMTELTGPGWVMLQTLKRTPTAKTKQG